MKNNPNIRVLSILVILLILINLGFMLIFYTKWFPGRPIRMRQGETFLVKELNLREDQKRTYLKMEDNFMDSIEQEKTETRKAKDAFFNLLKLDTLDTSILKSRALLASEKEISLDILTFYHFRKVRALLDKHQKRHFDQIIEMAIHSDGPQNGPSHRPGPPGSPSGPDDNMPPPPSQP
jgi:hypothetical protein